VAGLSFSSYVVCSGKKSIGSLITYFIAHLIKYYPIAIFQSYSTLHSDRAQGTPPVEYSLAFSTVPKGPVFTLPP
jgi:hypothetical protein